MPGVDGFEVVEQLRADPATADVPIVVLTSKDMTAPTTGAPGRPDQLPRPEGRVRPELVELVARMTRRAAPSGRGGAMTDER